MRLHRDERGLMGKLMVLWLLVFALVVLAAIDGVSILVTRVNVGEVAQTAADAAVPPLEQGKSEQKALKASLAAVADADDTAKLERFDVASDTVTVEVSDRANTILVGLFGLLDGLADVSATRTARISS
jgi:Flp pilus assembly protein TadG